MRTSGCVRCVHVGLSRACKGLPRWSRWTASCECGTGVAGSGGTWVWVCASCLREPCPALLPAELLLSASCSVPLPSLLLSFLLPAARSLPNLLLRLLLLARAAAVLPAGCTGCSCHSCTHTCAAPDLLGCSSLNVGQAQIPSGGRYQACGL